MKNNLNNLQDFVSNVHKLGYSLVDLNGAKVPCILVTWNEFSAIVGVSNGKHSIIDTNLNIFDDGIHVFVNININFINTPLEFDYLLYANETIDFFKFLSLSGMVGIVPHQASGSNVFFVQFPRKDQATKAYELIVSKLKDSRLG